MEFFHRLQAGEDRTGQGSLKSPELSTKALLCCVLKRETLWCRFSQVFHTEPDEFPLRDKPENPLEHERESFNLRFELICLSTLKHKALFLNLIWTD